MGDGVVEVSVSRNGCQRVSKWMCTSFLSVVEREWLLYSALLPQLTASFFALSIATSDAALAFAAMTSDAALAFAATASAAALALSRRAFIVRAYTDDGNA